MVSYSSVYDKDFVCVWIFITDTGMNFKLTGGWDENII